MKFDITVRCQNMFVMCRLSSVISVKGLPAVTEMKTGKEGKGGRGDKALVRGVREVPDRPWGRSATNPSFNWEGH